MIELYASKQKITETVTGSGMPDASSKSLHWSLYWLQRIFFGTTSSPQCIGNHNMQSLKDNGCKS